MNMPIVPKTLAVEHVVSRPRRFPRPSPLTTLVLAPWAVLLGAVVRLELWHPVLFAAFLR
jgi:hypothetical protein